MKKRLTKSSNQVVLTGTLGGIAEWLGLDATLVRVIYVVLGVFSAGFPMVGLYILLAIVIPSAYKGENSYTSNRSYNRNVRNENPYKKQDRKEAEKVDDDDWSDF